MISNSSLSKNVSFREKYTKHKKRENKLMLVKKNLQHSGKNVGCMALASTNKSDCFTPYIDDDEHNQQNENDGYADWSYNPHEFHLILRRRNGYDIGRRH